MVKLINVKDRFLADSIIALLQDNHIVSYSQAPHNGSMQNTEGGYSFWGYDIYVDNSDLKQAMEIVTDILPKEDDSTFETDSAKDFTPDKLDSSTEKNEFNKALSKHRRFRTIVLRLFVAITLLIWLALELQSILK